MSTFRTVINTSLVGFTLLASLSVGASSTAAPAENSTKLQLVRVFFPHSKQQNNLSYVQPVWRQTSSSAVAQFAVDRLIAGPSSQERQQGFMPALRLKGASNCGKDFTLSIVSNVARVRFCRQIVSAGIGDDARAKSSINATLRQFPTIRSVVILDHQGNCFGDMSGDNRCLRS